MSSDWCSGEGRWPALRVGQLRAQPTEAAVRLCRNALGGELLQRVPAEDGEGLRILLR